MNKVRIWDLPTRLFHWTLAVCVFSLVITGNIGGNAMVWHFRFGYLVLTLLLFRLIWGFIGGYWSRWSTFPIGPLSVLAYLRGRLNTRFSAGHNPLGSISIVVMLLILLLQVATGLVSDDEVSNTGPLSSLVSSHIVGMATSWHKNWGKLLLISLVTLHMLALLWYRFKKQQSLTPAMWHGDKALSEIVRSSTDHWKSRVLALLVFCITALIVFTIIELGH